MINVRPKTCKSHKKYKAIRKPSVRCLECWEFYLKKHPNKLLNNECCIPMEIYKHHISPKPYDIVIDKYKDKWYIVGWAGVNILISINYCPFCGFKLL